MRRYPHTEKRVMCKGSTLKCPPKPPAGLNAVAKRYWQRWTVGLCKRGALASEDLPVLATLCKTSAEMDQLGATYCAEGIVVQGSRGRPMVHAAYRAWKSLLPAYLALTAQFGLTPMSRGKLIAHGVCKADAPEPHVDPLDAILNRHRS
jgi:P27 family predicted phage terminase small subunit